MNFKKWFEWDSKASDGISHASVIGLHFVSCIFVGALLGYYLDKWLGTWPLCAGIMFFLGIVAGFRNVYIDAKKLIAADKRNDEAKKQQRKISVQEQVNTALVHKNITINSQHANNNETNTTRDSEQQNKDAKE